MSMGRNSNNGKEKVSPKPYSRSLPIHCLRQEQMQEQQKQQGQEHEPGFHYRSSRNDDGSAECAHSSSPAFSPLVPGAAVASLQPVPIDDSPYFNSGSDIPPLTHTTFGHPTKRANARKIGSSSVRADGSGNTYGCSTGGGSGSSGGNGVNAGGDSACPTGSRHGAASYGDVRPALDTSGKRREGGDGGGKEHTDGSAFMWISSQPTGMVRVRAQ